MRTSHDEAPVVVVGTGPVGVRFAQAMQRRAPNRSLVVYGGEPWEPYNRVQLSAFLAGDADWNALTQGLVLPGGPNVDARLHCLVIDIDRAGRRVQDATGRWQPYSELVLATGSRARVPDVPGIGQDNCFVFRDMADAQRLYARRTRSQRTVVLGGGLLGLEAARAMQRFNTEVWVIEHGPRLMANQLDDTGAALLRERVVARGIHVLTDARVKAVHGHGRVEGVTLRTGERIDCDTVLIAAGIQPNLELALDCGLAVGRGIRVDDDMRTSDPYIYAVGECAEHRGQIYGLVAPGLEQADVAAHSLTGGASHYTGSIVATRLKVLDAAVFSMGELGLAAPAAELRVHTYGDPAEQVHRRVVTRRGRLVGALAVGPCDELARLQEAVLSGRRVWPWALRRFRRSGQLWQQEEGASVVHWPASAVVCNCNGVTCGQLRDALGSGCKTVDDLAACTRASTVCGSCKPLLMELAGAGSAAAVVPLPGWRVLATLSAMGCLAALILLLVPGLPFADSVQSAGWLDQVWRQSLWKQMTGFSVLGLTLLGLLLSLNKRVSKLRFGRFDVWRLVHVSFGLLAAGGLYVHTGGRLGHQLDGALMLFFSGLLLLGALGSAVIAAQHRLAPATAKRWRSRSVWVHILLFWPVPVLLAFHVFKSYYF